MKAHFRRKERGKFNLKVSGSNPDQRNDLDYSQNLETIAKSMQTLKLNIFKKPRWLYLLLAPRMRASRLIADLL